MPEIIHARVSNRILDKADRLFTNYLGHIFIELLQNARRAGASLVTVSVKPVEQGSEITFTDNGSGIEDFSKILFLGEKGWDETIEAEEDPAGMGMFSLLHSGVTIRSRGKEVVLSPESFSGKADAFVLDLPAAAPNTGTTLVFTRPELPPAVDGCLCRATKYGPINVELNGKVLPREDFLAEAVSIKEIPGARIGIFLGDPRCQERVNFHGLVINDSSLDCHLGDILNLESQYNQVTQIHTKVDIISASRLHLKLPDRSAVVRDELYTALLEDIKLAVYEYIATVEHHLLPYKVYKAGIDMGVSLKEASPYLEPYGIFDNGDVGYDESGLSRSVETALMDPSKCVRAELNCDPEEATDFTFQIALDNHQLPNDLVAINSNYGFEGYSWYDKIGKLSDHVMKIDETIIDGSEDSTFTSSVTLVDSIQFSFVLNGADGEVTPILWDLDIAAWKGDSGDNPALVLTKTSPWVVNQSVWEPHSLQQLVAYVGFSGDDDHDVEDLKSGFDSYWEKEIASAIHGELSAAKIALDDAINYTLTSALEAAGLTTVILEKTKEGWKARIPAAA